MEVRFAPVEGGRTRIDLEHRYFERMGPGSAAMRTAVDSPGGWGGLLALYASRFAHPETGDHA